MTKEFTCIMCPNGCDIEVKIDRKNIISSKGNLCNKGREYVDQELNNPQRNIATSVRVYGGHISLVSVRLTKPIPKEKIFEVMEEIKKVKLKAPVLIGQVVIQNVLNLNSDFIATKNIEKL